MTRVLITGMSATGKSTVLRELTSRGWTTVDLDDGYVRPLPDGRQQWDEALVDELLTREVEGCLAVAGCEDNMGRFLPRFDLVVLLSVPVDVLVSRVHTREGNDFGRRPGELERILADQREIEPLLRRIADLEIVTTMTVVEVADRIVAEVADRS